MSARQLLEQVPEVGVAEAYPEPQPLEGLDTPQPPALSPHLLPPVLGNWAFDKAERMNAPVEFLAVSALAVAAGVVGNRVLVAPDLEANPGWLEALNLWALLVGEPGSKKTPCMDAASGPIMEVERKLHEEHQQALKEYETRLEAYRQDKNRDPHDKPELPPDTALLAHDITPEKLADLLEHNPHGLLSAQDEMLGLIATWERPERAGERQFYLKCWGGVSAHTVKRIKRGSSFLPLTTLSLLGGTQPGPLRRYITEAAKGWTNDGLLQRFQVLVSAEVPPYARAKGGNHAGLDEAYGRAIQGLWGLEAKALSAESREIRGQTRPVLAFDEEAQALYLQWLEGNAHTARQPDAPTLKKTVLEKQAGLTAKLAALLHLLEGGRGAIGARPTLRAIAWADYLQRHTFAVYWEAIKPDLTATLALGQKLRAKTKTTSFDYQHFSERDLERQKWKHLTERWQVKIAVAELVDRGWLVREGQVYRANPRLEGVEG